MVSLPSPDNQHWAYYISNIGYCQLSIIFLFVENSSTHYAPYALHVNVEALTGSNFDGIKAMHKLFQVFRQYSGELTTYTDKDGNERIAVSFGSLMLMRSWMERYDKYQKEIQECEKIKDVAEKANALLRAEESFDLWMDIYPESETWLERLETQKKHDDFMDFLGNNPKNPE